MLMVQYATDTYPYIRIWGENGQHKQMDHDIHGQKIEYFTFGDNVLSPIFEINLHPIYNSNHVLQSHGLVRLVGKNANYQEYDVLKWHNIVSDPTLTINSQSNTPALTYHPTTNIFDLAANIIPSAQNTYTLGDIQHMFADIHSHNAHFEIIDSPLIKTYQLGTESVPVDTIYSSDTIQLPHEATTNLLTSKIGWVRKCRKSDRTFFMLVLLTNTPLFLLRQNDLFLKTQLLAIENIVTFPQLCIDSTAHSSQNWSRE